MSYLIPAAYTGISSWQAHRNRSTPSSEPGTDYYMPTGTPLGAPARCRVVEVGGSIYPATGRYVVLDDGTRWLRYLHLSRWLCSVGDELEPGQVFAESGASGYGSEMFGEPSRNAAFWANTGGDHVHVTAFEGRGYPAVWNGSGTVDFHALTGGKVASGAATAQEAGNMQSIVINGNQYGVDTEFITHYGTIGQATITRQVTSATDELHNLGEGKAGLTKFSDLLDGLGIPREVLDSAGRVKNPQSGRFEANGTWSRRREAVAKLDQVLKKL